MRIRTGRASTSSTPVWTGSRSPPANITTRSRTRCTPRESLSRNVDQSAVPFRDRLAVLDNGFPVQVNGSGEAPFHSLEWRPPAFVLYALRRDGFDLPRVHHDEVGIAAHLDRPFRNPQDLGGSSRPPGAEAWDAPFHGPGSTHRAS